MKKVLTAIIFLFCFAAFACAENPEADKYVKSGFDMEKAGDYAGAKDDFTRAIALDPDDAQAYNGRATAEVFAGNFADAVKDCGKAIEINPGFAEAYNNMGFAEYKTGNYDQAIKDYTRAIELKPDYKQAYANRAIAKKQNGDKAGAIEDAEMAKKLGLAPAATTAITKATAATKPETFIDTDTSGNAEFKAYFIMDGEVFPSFIVSSVEIFKKEKPLENEMGTNNGAFEVLAKGAKPGTHIKVSMFPNRFITSRTDTEYTLDDPGAIYIIHPVVSWDFEKLSSVSEPTNETFKIGIQVDNGKMTTKIFQPRIRSVNDCVYAWTNRYGIFVRIPQEFSIYVNENDPIIDRILKEAKELGLKANPGINRLYVTFSGNRGDIRHQAAMLWFLFQSKKFVYSDISPASEKSSKVLFQRVRSLEDTYSATLANCIDGSVLFASILTKIGIECKLVMKPGHCYLGVIDKKKGDFCIETTMLGNYQVQTPDLGSRLEPSIQSFEKAVLVADQTFKTDVPHYQNKDAGYYLVDIQACRAAGITPINK